MGSILTIFNATRGVTKALDALFPNAGLKNLIREMDNTAYSSGMMKLRIKEAQEKINSLKEKLSPSQQEEVNHEITSIYQENGLTPTFNENGQLNISMDDFIAQTSGSDLTGISDTGSNINVDVNADVDIDTDIDGDGVDSLWDFFTSLFN